MQRNTLGGKNQRGGDQKQLNFMHPFFFYCKESKHREKAILMRMSLDGEKVFGSSGPLPFNLDQTKALNLQKESYFQAGKWFGKLLSHVRPRGGAQWARAVDMSAILIGKGHARTDGKSPL